MENQNPYLTDPDVVLMLDFKAGNKNAFEQLMAKYYPRILNFIYRYINQSESAEDLTQEVFIKVYRNASSYEPKSKFQTWIYTIAKNVSLNELRKKPLARVSLDETLSSEDSEFKVQVEDPQAKLPSEAMAKEELAQAVRAAIQSLPENQKLAVILRRYENFSYEDIAQALNLSVEAVKSLLSRAKENLREKLAKLFD